MAKPFDLDLQVPLRSDGWVRMTVHVDDIEDMAVEDQKFLIDIICRVSSFVEWLVKVGLAPDAAVPEDKSVT